MPEPPAPQSPNPLDPVDADRIQAIPARHPGRWVASIFVAVLAVVLVNSVAMNPRFEWGLIRDNLRTRPIYFSWTTGGHPDRNLGLTQYLVSEGLVRRVNPAPVRPTREIILSQGLGFVDVGQSDRLMWGVYHIDEAARPRPRGWVDPPSASILSIYAVIYGQMSGIYLQAGDSVKAARSAELARMVQANLPQ